MLIIHIHMIHGEMKVKLVAHHPWFYTLKYVRVGHAGACKNFLVYKHTSIRIPVKY